MKRLPFAFLLLVLVSFSLTSNAQSEAEMKAWQEAMTPNDNHAFLAKMAGEWTYKSTWWMKPGDEPTSESGKSTKKMIHGERYLEERHTGVNMGMPFEGLNIFGYDNVTKKYRTCWIDNAGTGMMIGEGSREGNMITIDATYPNPMGESDYVYILTYEVNGADTHTMVMYMVVDDQKMKTMEIVFTRK